MFFHKFFGSPSFVLQIDTLAFPLGWEILTPEAFDESLEKTLWSFGVAMNHENREAVVMCEVIYCLDIVKNERAKASVVSWQLSLASNLHGYAGLRTKEELHFASELNKPWQDEAYQSDPIRMFHAKGSFLKTGDLGRRNLRLSRARAISDSTVALWKSRRVWWSSISHILCPYLIETQWEYECISGYTLNSDFLFRFF